MSPELLVEIRGLTKHYGSGPLGGGRLVQALDRVDLALYAGETLGLVGESGCGKSTLGRCLLRLEEPTAGTVTVGGREITGLSERQLRPLRRDMQMIFQDPYSSLNPRKRVGAIIGDVLRLHGETEHVAERVRELLQRVGLAPEHAARYPREFSGGQRQRVGVARALALTPRLIVADEPVSALDVSVQAQVVNLLDELQDELGLTYLFIAHDLGVVRHVSDRIGVMYLGRIVELAPADAIYAHPLHPYTEALLAAVPVPDPDARARPRIVLRGELPSPAAPPPGCHFHTRCPRARELCVRVSPPLVDHGAGRSAACHYPVDATPEQTERALVAAGVTREEAASSPLLSPTEDTVQA